MWVLRKCDFSAMTTLAMGTSLGLYVPVHAHRGERRSWPPALPSPLSRAHGHWECLLTYSLHACRPYQKICWMYRRGMVSRYKFTLSSAYVHCNIFTGLENGANSKVWALRRKGSSIRHVWRLDDYQALMGTVVVKDADLTELQVPSALTYYSTQHSTELLKWYGSALHVWCRYYLTGNFC